MLKYLGHQVLKQPVKSRNVRVRFSAQTEYSCERRKIIFNGEESGK